MASRSRPCARSSSGTTASMRRTGRSGGSPRASVYRPRSSPSSRPYDIAARYARRGGTRWKGLLAHDTETCDPDRPQRDQRRHHHQGPRPHHQGNGRYLSVALKQQVAREHGVGLVGPIRARSTRQSRKGTVFHAKRSPSTGTDAKEVTCPQGKVSRRWSTLPSLAPYVNAEFAPDDCRQCPVKAAYTRTDARKVSFLPRDLYGIQSESRAEQQTQNNSRATHCGPPPRARSASSSTATACSSVATAVRTRPTSSSTS